MGEFLLGGWLVLDWIAWCFGNLETETGTTSMGRVESYSSIWNKWNKHLWHHDETEFVKPWTLFFPFEFCYGKNTLECSQIGFRRGMKPETTWKTMISCVSDPKAKNMPSTLCTLVSNTHGSEKPQFWSLNLIFQGRFPLPWLWIIVGLQSPNWRLRQFWTDSLNVDPPISHYVWIPIPNTQCMMHFTPTYHQKLPTCK